MNHPFATGMISDCDRNDPRRAVFHGRGNMSGRPRSQATLDVQRLCALEETSVLMWWPAIRSDSDVLRALVIGVGLCWSVAFVAIALRYELELYADGAMFSYAVAVQD